MPSAVLGDNIAMKKFTNIALTGALLAVAISANPSTACAAMVGAPKAADDAGTALAAAIKTELAKQPATASAEELEAVIVFVVSQGAYTDDAISAALNEVGAGATGNLATAVANARVALLKKKRRGTGAITGGGGSSAFSSPGGGGGGGGNSNYQ